MNAEMNPIPQIELHYISDVSSANLPVVHDAYEAYQLFMQSWNRHQIELMEEFKVMLLNNRNVVLGIVNIATSKPKCSGHCAYPQDPAWCTIVRYRDLRSPDSQ